MLKINFDENSFTRHFFDCDEKENEKLLEIEELDKTKS